MRGDARLVEKLEFHTAEASGLAHSEGSRLLATGGDDGRIALYDVRTWKRIQSIDNGLGKNRARVKRIAIDSTGKMLAAACSGLDGDNRGMVLVYDIEHLHQPKQVAKLTGHGDIVFDVVWGVEHSDAKKSKRVLVSASRDATSRMWVEK